MASIYQGFIKDEAGNIIDGASVEVRDQDTNSLVTIWSNRAATSTKTNPTTTDANGYYFFYRTAGRYKITVTSDSYSATFNNVPIGTAAERDTGTDAGDIPLISDLSTVATTGAYSDLTGTPTLGTMAAQNTGTASGEFRTNSDNDSRFFRIGNNLSEGTASAMRANLELGTAATTDATAYATAAQGSTADTALQPNTAVTVESVTATTWAKVGSYTVAGAGTLGADTAGAGAIIYVTDETGGAVLAYSDGTSWRRCTDREVIS